MFKYISAAGLLAAIILVPSLASAHVVVMPSTVNIGEFTTFTMGVPNEKAVPVTSLKLELPDGLNHVTPTVKPGWNISTEKSGEGEDAKVTAIIWTGGTIAAGLRDDFTFSAQAPEKATDLNWKAYQTYEDGTVASWNQPPNAKETNDDNLGPYSTTKTINDLAAKDTGATTKTSSTAIPLVLSLVAVTLSVGSLLFKRRG